MTLLRRLVPVLLLASAPLLLGAHCGASGGPSPKEKEQAQIHYDLGVNAMQNGDSRNALTELQKAIELDPNLDLAHMALALVYQHAFSQPAEAEKHYKRAIEINPKFSDAYNNLGSLYLEQGRYDEAIPLFEKALSDLLYRTPYIAMNNLGWALYKKGDTPGGINQIAQAIGTNPKFCLGYKNLGVIYSETGQPEKALDNFGKYAKHCPDEADAHHRFGVQMIKLGDQTGAKKELQACIEKGHDQPIADECQKLLDVIGRQ